MEMGPEFCVLGAQNFFGYVVYGFPTMNLYIFESNGINNATYAFRGDWEAASMLTKMEVLSGGLQHVTPRPDGRWQVIGAGNSKATAVTNTQKEAADIARRIAINQQSERLIHRTTGEIRQKNSYGNDPYPPKG